MRTHLGSLALIAAVLAFQTAASAQSCPWRPWAWHDSNITCPACPAPLNSTGPCVLPNWDYSFSQGTLINMSKDTPPGGGAYSFHFFLDQLSSTGQTTSHRWGSGGLYQQIAVQSGVPLQYSFYWKGKAVGTAQNAWFEFLLIDGPFTTNNANDRPDDASGNNPYIMRKKGFSNSEFPWTPATDQDPADTGPAGPRPQTLTPITGVVTVVLKAGCTPLFTNGGVEAFFDRVVVQQAGGPNLVVGGDFEDAQQQPLTGCGNESMSKDPSQNNYWIAVVDQCPVANQHTLLSIDPPFGYNNTDTNVTLTGTNLENITGAKLVPVGGGTEIVANAFTPPPGPNATSVTVTFPTTGQTDGTYDVVTLRGTVLACQQRLAAGFTLRCPNVVSISAMSPASVTDPSTAIPFTLSGTNTFALTTARLEYIYSSGSPAVPIAIIPAASFTPSGSDTQVTFDFGAHCPVAGVYRLIAAAGGCREVTLNNALRVIKTPPAGTCVWHPWAANWSTLNKGTAINPPANNVYNPTNWDYSLSQATLLNTPKDTPDGSAHALHWFLDAQPIIPPPVPPQTSNGAGSGGVYQEIAVQPSIPLQYSYSWKAANGSNGSPWFELMLIDGPFNIGQADIAPDNASGNNPSIIRKRTLAANGSFPWGIVTDQTAADVGPAGPRPQTMTPSGSVVTVILKAGIGGPGAMESFFDNVVVQQNGGPNLIVNGDFEDSAQQTMCDTEDMSPRACETGYWMHSGYIPPPTCPVPFADTDKDGDVDQDDFAILQICYTGQGAGPIPSSPAICACLDVTGPSGVADGAIDQLDVNQFERCASGPNVPADPHCAD